MSPTEQDQIKDWLSNIRQAWHCAGGSREVQKIIFYDLQRALRHEPKPIRQAVWRGLSDSIREEFRSYGQEKEATE